jgi:phosphatidate cytidylyltransferase
MTVPPPSAGRFGDLPLRILSSLVLAALVLFDLWLGGLWVAALAALAAVLMLWELHRMVTGDRRRVAPVLVVMAAFAVAAVFVTGLAGEVWGFWALMIGAVAVALLAPGHAGWLVFGLLYIGFAMAYVPVIRDDPLLGLAGVVWLVLVVAAADIGAYFTGRTFGGPKLWPRVSPKKTWSGAIGGLVFATVVAMAFGFAMGWRVETAAGLSIGVAVASQVGDLVESSVKRRWGVKDASNLIPGHGGVMDRLDGLVGGLWFFALYDILGGSLGG